MSFIGFMEVTVSMSLWVMALSVSLMRGAPVGIIHAFPALPFPGGSSNSSECKYFKENPERPDVSNSRYNVLERCVYYYLREKASEQDGNTNRMDAIWTIAPYNAQGLIDITVIKSAIDELKVNEANEADFYINMNGYITLSWMDPRLRWNTRDWNMEEIAIYNPADIWVPFVRDFNMMQFGPVVQQSNVGVEPATVTVKSDGNVTTTYRLFLYGSDLCEINYANYPDDMMHCCMEMDSELYNHQLKIAIGQSQGQAEIVQKHVRWTIKSVENDAPLSEIGEQKIRICVTAGRYSTTLRVELTLPMALSAILVLIAPLFGSIKIQLFVKLFALLFQFMCFQMLAQRSPEIGTGQDVPAVYKFYELTMVCTLVSLFITLIVYTLIKSPRKLPPSHWSDLAAGTVNRILCCFALNPGEVEARPSPHLDTSPVANGVPNGGSPGHSAATGWGHIWAALNAILSLLLLICYLVGVIAIFA